MSPGDNWADWAAGKLSLYLSSLYSWSKIVIFLAVNIVRIVFDWFIYCCSLWSVGVSGVYCHLHTERADWANNRETRSWLRDNVVNISFSCSSPLSSPDPSPPHSPVKCPVRISWAGSVDQNIQSAVRGNSNVSNRSRQPVNKFLTESCCEWQNVATDSGEQTGLGGTGCPTVTTSSPVTGHCDPPNTLLSPLQDLARLTQPVWPSLAPSLHHWSQSEIVTEITALRQSIGQSITFYGNYNWCW